MVLKDNRKETRMSFEEHQKFGEMLKLLRIRLNETVPKYSRKTEFIKSPDWKAYELLSKVKSLLDDILFRDFQEKTSEELTKIYYGEKNKT